MPVVAMALASLWYVTFIPGGNSYVWEWFLEKENINIRNMYVD
jgi:hypothetical protein